MIRVLLIEDHDILREGLVSLLESDNELKIVGQGSNGLEAVELAGNLTPDIIILDINLPELNGIEATRRIVANSPESKVLILTMMDHENYVSDSFDAGAKGFAVKNISRDKLIEVIKDIHAGETFLSPQIAKLMVHKLRTVKVDRTGDKLTPREMEVLELVAEGLINKEIADRLGMSKRTVEAHRKSLMEKTGTTNSASLIRFAVKSGLLK